MRSCGRKGLVSDETEDAGKTRRIVIPFTRPLICHRPSLCDRCVRSSPTLTNSDRCSRSWTALRIAAASCVSSCFGSSLDIVCGSVGHSPTFVFQGLDTGPDGSRRKREPSRGAQGIPVPTVQAEEKNARKHDCSTHDAMDEWKAKSPSSYFLGRRLSSQEW
jgi:hypothetical protein